MIRTLQAARKAAGGRAPRPLLSPEEEAVKHAPKGYLEKAMLKLMAREDHTAYLVRQYMMQTPREDEIAPSATSTLTRGATRTVMNPARSARTGWAGSR